MGCLLQVALAHVVLGALRCLDIGVCCVKARCERAACTVANVVVTEAIFCLNDLRVVSLGCSVILRDMRGFRQW